MQNYYEIIIERVTEPATCKDYLQVRQEGSRRVSRNLRVGEKTKRIKPMQNHYEIIL